MIELGAPFDVDECSIVATLDALGDSWSVLVLRELFYGVHRFNEMHEALGIGAECSPTASPLSWSSAWSGPCRTRNPARVRATSTA